MYTKLSLPILLSLFSSAFAILPPLFPTVYLIRHGEKPADGGIGLSSAGFQRSHCLKSTFSTVSPYNIGYIIAQRPTESGRRIRPYMTVKPLAESLNLEVDTHCERDDGACVAEAVETYRLRGGKKNVLICWEHERMTDIVGALSGGNEGVNAPSYPDDRFDLIWTDRFNYAAGVTTQTSECCADLDQC